MDPSRVDVLSLNTRITDVGNYATGGHKSSAHGIMFHEQYLLLTAYRSLAASRAFCMTCEVEQAGKFDDLVYFHELDGVVACELVQYKHKVDVGEPLTLATLVGRTKSFGLVDYFNSYVELVDGVRFETRFECRVNRCVLLTNLHLDETFARDDLERCDRSEMRPFCDGESFRFRRDAVDRDEIARELVRRANNVRKFGLGADVARARVDDFFARFVFSVGNPSDVSEQIKTEITVCLENRQIGDDRNRLDVVYKCLYNQIHHFHSSRDVRVATHLDCRRWLDEASEKIGSDMIPVYHEFNTNRLNEFGSDLFDRKSVERLERLLDDDRQVVRIVTGCLRTEFTVLKAIEALTAAGKSYRVILDDQLVMLLDQNVVAAVDEHLIVECNAPDSFDRISCKIGSVPNVRFVLIGVADDSIEHHVDMTSWDDLNDRTKHKMADKPITFQGQRVKFSTIDTSTTTSSIHEQILYEIIDGTLDLARPADRPDDTTSYYVDRKVSLRNRIDPKLFKTNNDRLLFIVENIDVEDFENLTGEYGIPGRFYRRVDLEESFERSCRSNRHKHVALVHFHDGEFYLKRSSDDYFENSGYVQIGNDRPIELTSLSCLDDRTVLIVAEPGMGKSNLVSTLIDRSVESDPGVWIVRIDLADHTERFYRMKSDGGSFGNTESAIGFIVDVQPSRTEFERELLRSYFEFDSKLVIVFDGFDEIAPDYRDLVFGLIARLVSVRPIRVWMTSRPQERDYLEAGLGLMAYAIVPFTDDDQKRLFVKFWKERVGCDEIETDTRTGVFVDRLLDVVKRSFSDRQIAGIPLQCRMLAEVYRPDFERFYRSGGDETGLPGVIDVLNIYEQFIDGIFNRYIVKKVRLDPTNQTNRHIIDTERRKLHKSHCLLSLDVVFGRDVGRRLTSSHADKLVAYKRNIVDGKERTGIVHSLVDDVPTFVHRTFAEYFAACWFHDRSVCAGADAAPFVRERLFRPEHDVFRRFFDRISVRRVDALRRVLNGDVALRLDDVASHVDDFGRNALHLAAAYDHGETIRRLVEMNVSTRARDRLLVWTPLMYGFAARIAWSSIERLLPGNETDRTMFDGIDDRERLLLDSSRHGHANLVDYLLKHRANIDVEDDLNRIPLHLAAKHGHDDVCASLIEHGSPINREDWFGMTPLHYACVEGHAGIAATLLARRADVNMLVCYRHTPLHYAFEKGHGRVVDAFVEHDADVLTRIKYAETLVHSAIQSGRRELVERLIRSGVDVNVKDYWNETPLDIATKVDRNDIVELLLENDAYL